MGDLKISVWDVKHGNAIYVRTPNNKHLVFDLGRGDYSENSEDRSPLETLYYHYGIRQIDFLTITHPHRDHIDDILNLHKFAVSVFHRPRNLNQTAIINASSDRDKAKFEKFFAMDAHYIGDITGTSRDTRIPPNYGDVEIQFFQTANLTDNLNNRSILTVLKYEDMKIIIPGDNECPSLDQLMNRDDFKSAVKNSDILIAPHHGRYSAYHSEFVKLVNPRISIVSDGSICDTSANQYYSANSRGWEIWKNGTKIKRYLLTTNSDGEIYINLGSGLSGRYLKVEIK